MKPSVAHLPGAILALLLLHLGCGQDSRPRSVAAIQNPFPVGVLFAYWEDSSRTDPHVPGPGNERAMSVQLWYPAADTGGLSARYLPGQEVLARSQADLPRPELFARMVAQTTSARLRAPVDPSAERFPLVLFSPALGGHSSLYTAFAERLAAQGYVVLGVNHKYESPYLLDAAGRLISPDHRYWDSIQSLKIPDQISAEQYRQLRGERIAVYAQDLRFCLDRLAMLDDSLFAGRLDLDHIGIFGHSLGGAVAIDLCRLDPRCAACLNMDGTPSYHALSDSLAVPFLFLEEMELDFTQPGKQIVYERREGFCRRVQGKAYRVLLDRAEHDGFSEERLLLADDREEQTAARRQLAHSAGFVQTFFDRHLRELPAEGLEARETDSLIIQTF